jgi:mono/diheme cytochrome c family protein
VLALIAPAALALAATKPPATRANGKPVITKKIYEDGRKLYRKYCGQCHALKEARAVGAGSGAKLGPGEEGGPSFVELRVTALQSKLAIHGVWDGHSRIQTLMTHKEINLVSEYTQAATKDHKYKAMLPSDAFR